jgi:hypothetical protein
MVKPCEFRGNSYRKLADVSTWTKLRVEPALEPDLPVIEPHHHVWDDERGALSRHRRAGLPACGLSRTLVSVGKVNQVGWATCCPRRQRHAD